MTHASSADVIDNAAWRDSRPRLSVLTPVYRYDPCALIKRIAGEADRLDGAVELLLVDDGTGDADLTTRIVDTLSRLSMPARLVTFKANRGRAAGRNRLFHDSRGGHVLFIDCDMAPDAPDFLARWLALVDEDQPPVAFGGFSLSQVEPTREQRLHYAIQTRGECISVAERARTPEKYVYTSNLLVRRDVFKAEAFDDGFSGWGWEDVEWGIRVAARFGVVHVDNPATHLGLDEDAVLLSKYESSAGNFARVVAKHGQTLKGYPSYRLARLLKRTPDLAGLRRGARRLAQSKAPLLARIIAAKVFRAAVYAEVIE